MRPVDRGEPPKDENGNPILFKKYQDMGKYLKDRLGCYCSYCECCVDSGISIEHIQPKFLFPEKIMEWGNLLLACSCCNGHKGATRIDENNIGDYCWPDRDNTLLFFDYISKDGLVVPAADLSQEDLLRAENTLRLLGLASNIDIVRLRRETIEIARLGKAILEINDSEEIRTCIERQAERFFSVWLSIFQDDEDMCIRFIRKFKGTATDCFDASGRPVPRGSSSSY